MAVSEVPEGLTALLQQHFGLPSAYGSTSSRA